ncbi:hypothetical protein [Actinocatenispora rupis]|uniref:Uncharacterized protein n=1 Tax=Actinocatenispora rupis TaxID=519421 RepID=A0A8J3J7B4_9ACTN|nr:hypothetical protein [Actinocatenispora rupis]GID13360.1 hypothetical protein Aru02nite_42490 [Actinocatenispora rupis]
MPRPRRIAPYAGGRPRPGVSRLVAVAVLAAVPVLVAGCARHRLAQPVEVTGSPAPSASAGGCPSTTAGTNPGVPQPSATAPAPAPTPGLPSGTPVRPGGTGTRGGGFPGPAGGTTGGPFRGPAGGGAGGEGTPTADPATPGGTATFGPGDTTAPGDTAAPGVTTAPGDTTGPGGTTAQPCRTPEGSVPLGQDPVVPGAPAPGVTQPVPQPVSTACPAGSPSAREILAVARQRSGGSLPAGTTVGTPRCADDYLVADLVAPKAGTVRVVMRHAATGWRVVAVGSYPCRDLATAPPAARTLLACS